MGTFSACHWLIVFAIVGVLAVVAVVLAIVFLGSRRAGGGPNLYPCPDCRRPVSIHAPVCPGCGRPLAPGAPGPG